MVALEDGLQIVIEKENQGDIASFVFDRLEAEVEDKSKAEILRKDLLDKASGVFLWVNLAITRAVKLSRQGEPLQVLQRRVRDLPNKRDELYQELLDIRKMTIDRKCCS